MAEQLHPKIFIRIYSQGGTIPRYQSLLASGCDLHAKLEMPVRIASMERIRIPTGLYIEIPPGYEGQIRPRSGQAFRKGLSLPNTPGTIDADYRGEIKIPVINLDTSEIVITPGERIAQLVIAPVVQAHFVPKKNTLSATPRQDGGFGSTGVI